MPKKYLTLADKIALLDKIKSQPSNISYRQMEEIIGIPKSTIARVSSQKVKLREQWGRREEKSKKRKRVEKDPEVEGAHYVVAGRGVRVDGHMLKTKSEDLARELGRVSFKATDDWLARPVKTEDPESDGGGRTQSERVTDQEAGKCIVVLRHYFMQDGNEDSPLSALDICTHFVQSRPMKKTFIKEENVLV